LADYDYCEKCFIAKGPAEGHPMVVEHLDDETLQKRIMSAKSVAEALMVAFEVIPQGAFLLAVDMLEDIAVC
jgi:hypothetical protein